MTDISLSNPMASIPILPRGITADLDELYAKSRHVKTRNIVFVFHGLVLAFLIYILQSYASFLRVNRNHPNGILGLHDAYSGKILKSIEENRRVSHAVLILSLTIPAGILYFDVLILDNFYIFKDTAIDTYVQFWPLLSFISRTLVSGDIPFWSFNLGLGTDVYPLWMFDPFVFIPALAGERLMPYGIGYAQFLRVISAGILFYAYLRTMGISRYVSIIGATLFAFSGHNIIRGNWWHYSTSVVALAFLLLGFEQYFMNKRRLVFVFSVTFVLVLHPFYWFHYSSIIFLYAIYRHVSKNGFDLNKLAFFIFRLGMHYLLGLGLGGFILLPEVFETLKDPRFIGNAFSSYDTFVAIPPLRLNDLETLLTSFLRTLAINIGFLPGWKSNQLESPLFYCGLSTLLLLSQVFNKKQPGWKGFLCILFLVLSYILFPYVRCLTNAFMTSYYKSSSFWISVAMIFISIHIFQGIVDNVSIHYKLLNIFFLFIVVLLSGVLTYYVGFQKYEHFNTSTIVSVFVFLIAYLAIFKMMPDERVKNIALLLFLIFVLSEAAVLSALSDRGWHRAKVSTEYFKQRREYCDYTGEALDHLRSIDDDFYRIEKTYRSAYLNDSLIQDYFGTKSYYSANTQSYLNFIKEMNVTLGRNGRHHYIIGFPERPILNTLVGVRYLLSSSKIEKPPFGYSFVCSLNGISIYKNDNYLPLGFVYDAFVSSEEFRKLSDTGKDALLLQAVVLDGDHQQTTLTHMESLLQGDRFTRNDLVDCVTKLRASGFNVTKHSQNRITGEVNVKKDGFLFFSIPFHTGWKAYVNGERRKIHLANSGFTGVFVEKGVQRVDLEFTPRFLWAGCFLSLASLCILLWVEYGGRRHRDGEGWSRKCAS